MTAHFVRHLLRPGDYVCTEFKCDAPEGTLCRMVCARCQKAQEEQGVCEYAEPPCEPDLQDMGRCQILLWFTEDAPEECYNGENGQPVRGPDWQPIVPEWDGDNYLWDYAPERTTPCG